jgi:hypothetical protein
VHEGILLTSKGASGIIKITAPLPDNELYEFPTIFIAVTVA